MDTMLDIIIPQYNESEELINHLLTSIENQIGINLSTILKVTIVNDHSKYKLSNEFLSRFHFPLEYIETPVNGGAGRARQYGMDHTSAPYIMFCDADDRLYDCSALMKLLNQIRLLEVQQKPWSYIWSYFYEEFRKDRAYDLISHDKPSMIFMHGKVWNRKFLQEHDIKFHPSLRTFEDTYFGKLVALVSPKSQQFCLKEYTYIWMRNPNSVTAQWNHDGKQYLYWQVDDYITCNKDSLKVLYDKRNSIPRWKELLMVSLLFTYFLIQSADFQDNEQDTLDRRGRLEDFFGELCIDYSNEIKSLTPAELRGVFMETRQDALTRYRLLDCNENWENFKRRMEDKYGLDLRGCLKL